MAIDFEVPDRIRKMAIAIREAGGQALLVGGSVRDRLLRDLDGGESSGQDPRFETKDYDLEVFGLPLPQLEVVLSRFGEVIAIGRSFGVLRVKGMDADISIPRRDSKVGQGHRGFIVDLDPSLSFAEAARRRDLTINSIGYDPLTGELLDPHGGREDLASKRLRATDPAHFGEDPLRGLRVAQFLARFRMEPDRELLDLCSSLDLAELPGERLHDEFRKLLLRAPEPSLGFEFLRATRLIRFFPELAAMIDVPQDPVWHPEGTVWEHTMMVLDEAARLRVGRGEDDWVLMLGALCHDLGKPGTTETTADGRIRSPSHEAEGVPVSDAFLARIRASNDVTRQVGGLVRHHLAPGTLVPGGAKAKAFRRLARKLAAAGIDARMLHRVATADHFGRTTPDALAREFPAGDDFLAKMSELSIDEQAVPDAVLGRHLIDRNMTPGKQFGLILEACRDLQDETGWTDAEKILTTVLDKGVRSI